MARGGVSSRALALTTPSVPTTQAPVLGLREKVHGQIAATRGKLDMLLVWKKWEGKKNRKKKPASSSDVTPESTPEKPKNKQWRKVNSAISSQKSNKQKPREPRSKDWPNWSTGSHPVHAAQQFSAAPSKATEGDGGPICKVQQKLAARMLDVVVLALFLLFSVPRQKN